MPEIADINGVAIANVAKVDAVTKANIADINGLTIPSAAAFLLDTYTGAAAAYSVRKLDKDYTGNCMRIRRDSDGAETDIGFDSSGDLDTSAISSHGGSSSCYVVTWYDQSGNSNNATQSTNGNQPQIYNGSGVITENGKPAIDFAGNQIFMSRSSSINLGTVDHLVTGVVNVGPHTANRVWFEEHSSSARYVLWRQVSDDTLQVYHNTVIGSGIASTDGEQYLITATRVGTTSTLYKDGGNSISGTAADFTSSGTIKIGIDQLNQGSGSWQGVIQEIVVWDSDQSSNRTGIETDINGYFSIYS